ncbi:hypothetical protein IVA98_08790 [Bradyrhizobium sp. 160]|uniref:hypothetical protein n=1 Tax=Bradyrhizobium sp. 160 TaxID=2782634 RepID=UPI001FF92FA7|nr:hypothetical protein [Bradyrhizobium sp. 160]MCK1623321.1 hypothetical protein [Bradyrhizobium sp. 160]
MVLELLAGRITQEQSQNHAFPGDDFFEQQLKPGCQSALDWDPRSASKCHSACNIDPLSRGIGVQN